MLTAMFFLEQNQHEFCSTIYLYIIYFKMYDYYIIKRVLYSKVFSNNNI